MIDRDTNGFRLFDGSAEGHQREPRKLEALFAEGDADDGDAPEQSRQQKSEAELQAAEDNPYNIQNCVFSEITIDVFSKGPEHQSRQFEALLTEGDADDGDTPNQSQEGISKPGPESRQQKPQNVSECFHSLFSSCQNKYSI